MLNVCWDSGGGIVDQRPGFDRPGPGLSQEARPAHGGLPQKEVSAPIASSPGNPLPAPLSPHTSSIGDKDYGTT